MRLLRGALALLLSYAVGVQPALAQYTAGRVAAPAVSGSAAAAAGAAAVQPVQLPALGVAGPLTAAPSLSAPSAPAAFAPALAAPAAFAAPLPAAFAAPSAPSAPAASAAPVAAVLSAPAAEKISAAERVSRIGAAASAAVKDIDRAAGTAARGKADAQFAALAEGRLAAADGAALAAPTARAFADAPARAFLDKPAAPAPGGGEKAGVPAPQAPKTGLFTVFRDPERNKSFWRYVSGYAIFLFGFEMYVVGLPYLISSMTMNALKEKHDARANDAEAVKELVRSNRSLSRIAHWAAQGLSYITIPLFTRNQDTDGPKKWLVKSMLIRAAVLGAVPVLFFSTGILGLTASMWLLFGLMAAQSFFQGISVTAEGGATTRLLGDKSVTHDERTKANSILTVLAAVIAIIGPLVAGQIALIGPVMGKTGVGGAVIYGIYAGAIAATGLIYATIRMFGGKSAAAKEAAADGGSAPAPAPKSLKSTLKELWISIKDGARIVFKDRLLRTMLLLSMVGSLFSDPLVFNVLPEYVEGLAAKSAGSLGAVMGIPGVGWFLKTLTATPMGNFALMMVMASIGSIAATLLMKPATKLFQKLGFKTEEALTIPFYVLAALEAPLFLLMIHTPTMLGVIALYGLQALATGFIGIAIQGLYQKNLGNRKDGDINKILAADSLMGIGAAILSTFAYGFLLKNIPIATSLIIAAVATAAVSLIRLAAPFLSFTKDQRKPPSPPSPPPAPTAKALPSTGAHNGPNSVQSVNL